MRIKTNWRVHRWEWSPSGEGELTRNDNEVKRPTRFTSEIPIQETLDEYRSRSKGNARELLIFLEIKRPRDQRHKDSKVGEEVRWWVGEDEDVYKTGKTGAKWYLLMANVTTWPWQEMKIWWTKYLNISYITNSKYTGKNICTNSK